MSKNETTIIFFNLPFETYKIKFILSINCSAVSFYVISVIMFECTLMINILKTKQKQIKAYEFNNPSLYVIMQ
jgi:hypothetical protein